MAFGEVAAWHNPVAEDTVQVKDAAAQQWLAPDAAARVKPDRYVANNVILK